LASFIKRFQDKAKKEADIQEILVENTDAIMIVNYLTSFAIDQLEYELKNNFLTNNIVIIYIYN